MKESAYLSESRIKETKEKILNWLKDEGLSPQENNDPKAYFSISIKFGDMGLGCTIFHDIRFPDCLFVAVNLCLPEDRITLYRNMTNQKKNDLLWDLRMTLIREAEVGSFQPKFGSSNELQSVFLCSRKMYYEELTKSKLMFTVLSIMRIATMIIWIVEKAEGSVLTQKTDQKPSYST
jgi:hypothetical protein